MAKRIGAEAKIIALFTALPDDSKRIVMDVIKSQTATPRKKSSDPKSTPAPSAGKRSSRKLDPAASTANSEGNGASALTASNPQEELQGVNV